MRLEIRFLHIDPSEALREHIERRLGFALRRFGDRFRSATVRVVDLNGPRGGVDKECRITLQALRGGRVVVRARAGDAYDAVTRAVACLDEACGRLFARHTAARLGRPARQDPSHGVPR